ncbi:MAG TPA: DUF4266 domain-containing protein, partial [Nevskia sp.]|nr:DUF4266 domain-containing protein [Nevskia sp.]
RGGMRVGFRWGALLLCLALLSGCAGMTPKAWQRGDLAQPEMAWDPDPVDAAIREHTYNSKEAATGSATVAGGGCGCN